MTGNNLHHLQMRGSIAIALILLAVTVLVTIVLWRLAAPRIASTLAERLREDEDTKKWIASLQAQMPKENTSTS